MFKEKEIIGNCTLYLGDCFDVMSVLPDNSIDMVLCDLPYGTTDCKWDTNLPLSSLWQSYRRLLPERSAVALTGSQPFTSALVMSNPSAYKHSWVWNKKIAGNFATAKFAPMKIHEEVLIFSFGRLPYNPIMIERDAPIKLGGNRCGSDSAKISKAKDEYVGKIYTKKFPMSILTFPRERGFHPTQQPVDLMAYMIRTYTNSGQMVMDNTMGSGTTCVAAVREGRKFIGIEREPEYFRIACQRIRDAYEERTPGPLFQDAAD